MKLRIETAGLDRITVEMGGLAREARPTMAKVLNQIGPSIRKATVAAETKQTNLKSSTINRAQKQKLADAAGLMYEITSEGGDVRAKFFDPKEEDGGVVAKPWGKSVLYKGGFMMGGRPGRRVMLKRFGGNVMQRVGSKRSPLRVVRTGLRIPDEMVKGETLVAFERGSAVLGDMVVARLAALLP